MVSKTISAPVSDAPTNDQYLVVGLGTGFNVCPVKKDRDGQITCLEAELGHVAPPASVVAILEGHFVRDADLFPTVEDCFSGRGLSKLLALIAALAPIDAAEVVSSHLSGSDPLATQALELMAELLGAMARDMILQYLPLGGLYFAGSVARGLFDSGFGPVFLKELARRERFKAQLQNVPVNLINDDVAALIGCVAASR